MTQSQKISLAFLRIVLGALFLYAGLTKVLDPSWSAAGYISGAKAFQGFFGALLDPSVLPYVDFANKWGLTLLGLSLIFGIGVRLSSVLGALLMFLYYLPLGFPYPNPHAYIVDEHIVYIAALLYLASARAGRVYGLEEWCASLPICRRFQKYRVWFG